MKKYNFLLLAVSCLVLLFAVGCIEENKGQPELDPIEDFVGKIPLDNVFNDLASKPSSTWKDFDNFYKEHVLTEKGAHYYNNLQWVTISHMIAEKNFLAEATLEDKEYYLEQIFSRDFVNEPSVAVLLLRDLQSVKTESEIASYARKVLSKNEAHLTPTNFEKHKTRNASSRVALVDMGYTRWGEEK